MVKLICFLRRKEGLTPEEFHRHWTENHGPLIKSLPNLARHIVRYEQHRRIAGTEDLGTEGYDGVTIQWFDRLDDFLAFVGEPDYDQYIYPDEEKFLDRKSLVWMMTEEPTVVIDGPTSG